MQHTLVSGQWTETEEASVININQPFSRLANTFRKQLYFAMIPVREMEMKSELTAVEGIWFRIGDFDPQLFCFSTSKRTLLLLLVTWASVHAFLLDLNIPIRFRGLVHARIWPPNWCRRVLSCKSTVSHVMSTNATLACRQQHPMW